MVLADSLAHAFERGLPPDHALKHFARRRRGAIRFYTLASRWLTPLFQSGLEAIAPIRDLCFGPVCRVGPAKRQMLLSLAGVKTGVFSASGLPARSILCAEEAAQQGPGKTESGRPSSEAARSKDA